MNYLGSFSNRLLSFHNYLKMAAHSPYKLCFLDIILAVNLVWGQADHEKFFYLQINQLQKYIQEEHLPIILTII